CLWVVLGGLLGCGAEVTVGGYDNDVAPGGAAGSPTSGGSGGGGGVGHPATPSCEPGAELETLYEVTDDTAVGLAIDEAAVFVALQGASGDRILAIDKQDGTPFELASADHPWGLATDAEAVFWVDDHEHLRRVNKDGTDPQVLLADHNLGQLTVDDTHVYLAVGGGGGSLLRIPKTGGAVETFAGNQDGPDSIAIDADAVYWLNAGTVDDPHGEVMKRSKSGGPVIALATDQRAFIWGLPSLVIDETHVYWAAADEGALRRVSKLGGLVQTLGEGVQAQGIALYGGSLYFTAPFVDASSELRQVGRLPIQGGEIVPILSSGQYNPWGIAVDERHVYWSSYVTTGPLTRACR
ncbi:MAG: hypothetical protein JRI68_34330, partial [Deltaproteobacteria bacterium]|nr:hypothetical protein [Deltaproteobacteria bacterium]